MPFSMVRWHGVRTDDPCADLYFLHHHQLFTAVLLPTFLYEGRLSDYWGQRITHIHQLVWSVITPPGQLQHMERGLEHVSGLTLYDNEEMRRCLISI